MSRSSTTTEAGDNGSRSGNKLPPIHPGEFLREDFLVPLGMSAAELARACGLEPAAIEAIVAERAPVTAEVALRLARYWGTSVELWTGWQMQFDIESAQDRLEAEIAKITPRPQAAE
jgi:addiction module HigA family antidote